MDKIRQAENLAVLPRMKSSGTVGWGDEDVVSRDTEYVCPCSLVPGAVTSQVV